MGRELGIAVIGLGWMGRVHTTSYRGCLSPEGVRFYTRGKAITSRWPQEAQDPSHHRGHMHFPTAV